MSSIPSAVRHIAKKIAVTPGVEASFVANDGAVDVVLERAFDRTLREHVIQIGMRALVPVRVFYRMPDGDIIGEDRGGKNEAIEDFYTNVHVAGFAGADPTAPADQIAGDAYGDDIKKDTESRDDNGQLKLTRIRAGTRGRPVVGWRYGKNALKVGDKVKFKNACVLQWTMGRTVRVEPGMTGSISQVSSKSPMAFLSMGGVSGIELPVHAVGHVYDIMLGHAMEHDETARDQAVTESASGILSRMMMLLGRGHNYDHNSPHYRGRTLPDLNKYGSIITASSEAEEDMLVPKHAKGIGSRPTGRSDDREGHVADREPHIKTRAGKTKRVLLSRR